ncbi:MAG: xylose isomerase, partial [Candidatus Omnitrophica bacterium]|nr:xylose isomerase [Candidatus Omnitrophota bacterium]
MGNYKPSKSDKFTFGLWTIGNPGRDPFGEPVRPPLAPHEIVKIVGELGGYGVNFHDNDLIPIDATASQRDQILTDFKKA